MRNLFHFYSLDSPKSLGYCFPQECDTFTCEPASTCHRCTAPRKEFLSTAEFASKSSLERRRYITRAAAGKGIHLRGMRKGEPVVDWGKAPDHIHKPGPNGPKASFFQLFHVLDFSMFSIFCFGGGLARPQSVRAQARMCAHMILLACSTEFQSVWSMLNTVAHVSKYLRMIADIGSHSRRFRPT